LPSVEVQGSRELIRSELKKLGRVSQAEKLTMIVFLATVALWVTRPVLAKLNLGSLENPFQPLAGLNDSTIVVGAALLLFLVPCKEQDGRSTFLMNWDTAKTLPWNVLLLFGGGLSLAAAIKQNKVAEFLGHQLAFLDGLPDVVVILIVVTMVVFLTELTSNIATTASVLPVLAGLAIELNMHPALLAIPAAMSASCAFMLPVATAPNAIVFGSGQVGLRNMIRAGLVLNVVSIGLITLFTCTLVRWILGL
jgi:sodium-dependent dicarboxylate transporter 2/3/5